MLKASIDLSGKPGSLDIRVPDFQAALRIAMKRAMEIMAADLREGKLNLSRRIVIKSQNGKVMHIIRFRDLVEGAGAGPN